jgi:cytochrome b561
MVAFAGGRGPPGGGGHVAMGVTETGRYTATARKLHWIIAVLVILNIFGGLLIANVEGLDTVYNLHRSFGFVIMVLAFVRLFYRLSVEPPELPAHMPLLQKLAAETVHWAMYAFLILTPFLGWIASNAFGASVSIFWIFNLPNIVAKDEGLFKIAITAHKVLGITFALAICAHIGGALFHTFVQKDGILNRMWPV